MVPTARQGPAAVWIELTSRCPLRCVFCSRENLRGEGEHMDIGMVADILGSLDRPEIIRLNYSGESGNYPWLIEAIRQAKETSAQVEMVTALVSMPLETVERLGSSGIDRISISLHTLNDKSFPQIYGGGTLESMLRRMKLLTAVTARETMPPAIDFAAVATQSNVGELADIAGCAASLGAVALSIHPVIRRAGVPELFGIETEGSGDLTAGFRTTLESSLEEARQAHPELRISVARPDLGTTMEGARRSFTCEQNPFETMHVLANGDVVACEVLDRQPLGNLRSASLTEIWQGPCYRDFRSRYEVDRIPECGSCIFRSPAEITGAVTALWGWHNRDASDTLWARTTASFECDPDGARFLILKGLLPPAENGNSIAFFRDGEPVATVRNNGKSSLEFQVAIELNAEAGVNRFIARTQCGYSPWRRGISNDSRELGFALFDSETSDIQPRTNPAVEIPGPLTFRRTAADLLASAVRFSERRLSAKPCPPHAPPGESLAVIVPERGSPAMLAECLEALRRALLHVSIPTEVVVVVNGSNASQYRDPAATHGDYRFLFVRRPLGFGAAIGTGLRHATAGWTYLLNSDVLVNEHALAAILKQREPGIFSLASRIAMSGGSGERETNRTGIEFVDGLVRLTELPGSATAPVEHLYSGGGSSLFQTAWLRTFIAETACYDPFYWEDAEWGMRARSLGLRNIFVPESTVLHRGRATVGRFYQKDEVARIFERNRIQFQLRCFPDREVAAVRERLAHAPWKTLRELLLPTRVASMARARVALREPEL